MFERFNASGPTLARTDVGDHRSRLTTQNGYAGGRQEATDDPVIADNRNFYKVELWTRDDRIERMLIARTSLDQARAMFTAEGYRMTRKPEAPAGGAADDPVAVPRSRAVAGR